MKIQEYRSKIEQKKGQKKQIASQIDSLKAKLKELEELSINLEEAILIVQIVGQQTQQQLEYRISDIVSLAQNSVFDDPYRFLIEFTTRRNKTEADLFFEKYGEKINPMYSSGGGPVDVASFALRIALWNLSGKSVRNCIILDEPFRFLSNNLQPRASEMLKTLSSKLNLQFIIVTHNKDLMESADKTFHLSLASFSLGKNNWKECIVLNPSN